MRYTNTHTAVIIATRNRPALLANAMAKLIRQSHQPGQIIIVSSSDGAHQRDEALCVKAVKRVVTSCVYYPVKHINKAHSLNAAVGLLAHNIHIVAFTDDDCLVPKNWIARHLANHTKYQGAGVITGKCISYQSSGFVQMYNEITSPPGNATRLFPFALGGNMSIKREMVGRAKWFDEQYDYCEDYEASQYIAAHGFPTMLDPKLVVETTYPAQVFLFLRRAYLHGRYEYRVNEAYQTILKDLYTPGRRHPVLRTLIHLPFLGYLLTAQYIREKRSMARYPWYLLFESAKVAGMMTGLISHRLAAGVRRNVSNASVR